MCTLADPLLASVIVPRAQPEWEQWHASDVPLYNPFVDAGDSEEEGLNDDLLDDASVPS